MPDEDGIALGPLIANTPVTHTQSHTFTIGSVTTGSYKLWMGMSNIEVVAFVQDAVTDEIYQSATVAAADPPVGIASASHTDMSLRISPNPAHTRVKAEASLAHQDAYALEVRDVSGRLVWRNRLGDQHPGSLTLELPAQTWPAGLYFVELFSRDAAQRIVKKLVWTP